ncbi:MAG: EAL domain-containing protein [Kineosporiaceae bacterium]
MTAPAEGRRMGAAPALASVGLLAVLLTLAVSAAVARRDRAAVTTQLDDWAAVTSAVVQRRLDTETERLESLLPPGPARAGIDSTQWWDGVDRVADRARAGQWRAALLLRPGEAATWYRVEVPGRAHARAPASLSHLVVWDSTPLLRERDLPPELALALARARDTGRRSLSAPIAGPRGPVADAARPGTALVVPLYDDTLPDAAVTEDRRAHVAGWIVADLVLADFLGDGLPTVPEGASAAVVDPSGTVLAGRAPAAGSAVRVRRPLPLDGLDATLVVTRPQPGPPLAPAPLASGLGVIAVLLLLAFLRVRAEGRAQRLVRERTAALSERTRELELVTDGSPDVMLRLAADGTVRFANPAARAATGMSDDGTGRDLVGSGVDAALAARLLDAVAAVHREGTSQRLDLTTGATTATAREYEVSVVPVHPGEDRDTAEVLLVGRDVTERRQAERLLAHRALYDPLTGLANRALVEERLAAALAPRDGCPVAVLMLDVDRFTLVNDSLGHAVGDDLLVQVGQRLRELATREQDAVGRLGGDEFVVVAALDHPHQVHTLARRMLAAFDEPFLLQRAPFTFTASLGVAVGESTAATGEELLSRADAALYRAKAAGGNGLAVYEPTLADTALGRLMRAEELRGALGADELFLAYQPEVDLRRNEVVDLEALVRWRHPRLGVVGPGGFVPVAEETGLIVQLGHWVLDQAVADAAAHNRDARRPVRVWVNVSARQLALSDLGETVKAALQRHHAKGSWLGVEVTESAFVADDVRIENVLQELRADGVAVAVDDFGTGWSSLSRLQGFPVDVLKVDQAFVRALAGPSGERAEHIVRAIVAMGQALSATVVAEGIETDDELRLVAELGCDLGQGYLLARPTTWDEAVTAVTVRPADGRPS